MNKQEKRQEQRLAFVANKIYGRGWRKGLSGEQITQTLSILSVLIENRPMPAQTTAAGLELKRCA